LSDYLCDTGDYYTREAVIMEVKYVVQGEPGKTCADCKNFKDTGNGKGDCYGHEVLTAGSCNLFEKK
jgi:hypothetical protein